MKLYLYNTVTKLKQEFIPLVANKPKMYVCGPTVYSAPHLGNGLSVIVFDLLYRVLCHIYEKQNVTYVRNITDVDDKINNAAKERGIAITELTKEVTDIFHNNTRDLKCLGPNFEPKVTDHIPEIIAMISTLLEKGYAYENEGHVFFEISKYKDYGKLAGRKIDELVAGARVDVSPLKKDPADFVLWKPEDENYDPSSSFVSPWGKGRPGWHIECSAMSAKYLGSDFDIHGGGVDLVFPHHTNEIAQSCCAVDGSIYANIWMHNGFLTVAGEKMSKSLGNFITINDLINSGVDGEIIRFHALSSHYRKPMDWNEEAIVVAKKALDGFYKIIASLDEQANGEVPEDFLNLLADDLNTPAAYAYLHDLTKSFNKATNKDEKIALALKLKSCANLMGFLEKKPAEWFKNDEVDSSLIEDLLNQRKLAKLEKNYKLADELRQKLDELNITLEDNNDSTTAWRRK
jgi:cysteinyl-tRNA synthetase